jgi:hypothetical protein
VPSGIEQNSLALMDHQMLIGLHPETRVQVVEQDVPVRALIEECLVCHRSRLASYRM